MEIHASSCSAEELFNGVQWRPNHSGTPKGAQIIHGEQAHLPANKQHSWVQLPTQAAPEIPRLGSWKEQSSLVLVDFAQASAKALQVPTLGRRDLPLQSCSPAQGAGNHHSHTAPQQLRKLHKHHVRQGVHSATSPPSKAGHKHPFLTNLAAVR